jgi:hypothetical protein
MRAFQNFSSRSMEIIHPYIIRVLDRLVKPLSLRSQESHTYRMPRTCRSIEPHATQARGLARSAKSRSIDGGRARAVRYAVSRRNGRSRTHGARACACVCAMRDCEEIIVFSCRGYHGRRSWSYVRRCGRRNLAARHEGGAGRGMRGRSPTTATVRACEGDTASHGGERGRE